MQAQIIGAPIQSGAGQPGCIMGPDALRTAGLVAALEGQGVTVSDRGNLALVEGPKVTHPNPVLKNLQHTADWVRTLRGAADKAMEETDIPIFIGGDHSMAAATLPAAANRAARAGKPLFVLWLDAHPDMNTLESTVSGNLHGCPVAYAANLAPFPVFPEVPNPVDPTRITMLGLRSVDPPEAEAIHATGVDAYDMRAIDERGVAEPLRAFLERVAAEDGHLHLSFDVDFLDPAIAPAVGTTVPGGATFREAHLIMEMVHDSGRLTSLDLVELNPFLDDRGRTALLVTDLVASLFGRRVLDRPNRPNAGRLAA
ncbi:arginase [Pseudaestuariivita atlantica]|uniref:Arginase n=1 Tax=Pseudaestuariivita atlantica TaxID=1317121 RepID=A0A0L1JVU5_9RHOB|nr:arginase [Pseudaestuariivita atlantica]KNG95498.1 arginase [Pseudaestuariivita atlantica]